ncbi:MAG: zf-HC2 domain-containing protein [Dehalococcoidia bacterium]|nr:zf-HC2 domain-containing protein [Dehalococcoidia bacterium]
MKCDRAKEGFQNYIEGVLTGRDLLALEDHLRSCPDCRQELDSLTQLDARLRQEVPSYWQSIEPSEGFMARLKQIEIEPKPAPAFKPFEGLSALWGKHRTALAAGLAVCMVIVLALSVPQFLSSGDDDESEIVSKNLTQGESATSTNDRMLTDTGALGGDAGAPGPDGTSALVTLSPSVSASGSGFTIPSTTLPPEASPAINYTAEQALALEIALADPNVQQALRNRGGEDIQMFSVIDFDCTGTTVVLESEKADPQEPPLYILACVNLDDGKVIDFVLAPNELPATIPEPPTTPTPSPLFPEPSQ